MKHDEKPETDRQKLESLMILARYLLDELPKSRPGSTQHALEDYLTDLEWEVTR